MSVAGRGGYYPAHAQGVLLQSLSGWPPAPQRHRPLKIHESTKRKAQVGVRLKERNKMPKQAGPGTARGLSELPDLSRGLQDFLRDDSAGRGRPGPLMIRCGRVRPPKFRRKPQDGPKAFQQRVQDT